MYFSLNLLIYLYMSNYYLSICIILFIILLTLFYHYFLNYENHSFPSHHLSTLFDFMFFCFNVLFFPTAAHKFHLFWSFGCILWKIITCAKFHISTFFQFWILWLLLKVCGSDYTIGGIYLILFTIYLSRWLPIAACAWILDHLYCDYCLILSYNWNTWVILWIYKLTCTFLCFWTSQITCIVNRLNWI